MGINCGSLGVTMIKQSLLTCACGEAALTALLVSALVKTQHLLLAQEYMKLLTIRPKMRGDHHSCYPNKAIDAEDGDENEDEGKDGEGEDLSHKDGNPDSNKNNDKKGPDQEESDEEDDDDDQEEDGDDDKDDEEDEEDIAEEGDDEEEEEVREEDEDEEETLQPPKKRKK